MGLEQFEIAVVDPKTKQTVTHTATPHSVRFLMPSLKRENAHGKDIFLKPMGRYGSVILDKADPEKLADLRKSGYAPSLVVEAANRETYAVVKLSDKPLDEATRTLSAQALARHFMSNKDVAEGKSYVRLAGFTDQRGEGDSKPYVLAYQGAEAVAPSAHKAIGFATKTIESFRQQEAEKQRKAAEAEAKRLAAEKAAKEALQARQAASHRDVVKVPKSDRGRGMSR